MFLTHVWLLEWTVLDLIYPYCILDPVCQVTADSALQEFLVTELAPIDADEDGYSNAVRVSLWANQGSGAGSINTNESNLRINNLTVRGEKKEGHRLRPRNE